MIAVVFGGFLQDEPCACQRVQQHGQRDVDYADAGPDPVAEQWVFLNALMPPVAGMHDAGALVVSFGEDAAKAWVGGDDGESSAWAEYSAGLGEHGPKVVGSQWLS